MYESILDSAPVTQHSGEEAVPQVSRGLEELQTDSSVYRIIHPYLSMHVFWSIPTRGGGFKRKCTAHFDESRTIGS